jgi:hypothetical protein
MKHFITFLIVIAIVCQGCSERNNFDKLTEREFSNCPDKDNCVIDLSKVLTFDWETMYFFTNAYSLSEIDSILGFHLTEWYDVGDRIVFVKNNRVVYYQEWFPYPSDEIKNVVVFDTNKKYFRVSKKNAVFSIRKENDFYWLKQIIRL